MLEIFISVLLVFSLGSLEKGWPNEGTYTCPSFCAVNHKHLAFGDTLVVSLIMANNGNTDTLGGFFDLVAEKQGTEIDALPLGERSVDNLNQLNKVAKETAISDMDGEGMTTEFFDDNKAFATKKKEGSRDALVDEATLDITRPKYNLNSAISEVNELFSSQEGKARLSNQTQFMNRIAATESNYGADTLGDYSFGAFQVDPIRYIDIIERSKSGAAKERMDLANEFLKEKLGDKDFDLRTALDYEATRDEKGYVTSAKYKPNKVLKSHNPYIGAVLTRLGLASDTILEGEHKGKHTVIPTTLEGQAEYWKKHWNKSGKGNAEKFMRQVAAYENR